MSETTFEVMSRIRQWKSYGAVTFANQDVANDPGNLLKVGYYPCAGAKFDVVSASEDAGDATRVHWWDYTKKKIEFLDLPAPTRPRGILKMRVSNPSLTELVDVGNDPLKDAFPPQALMDDDFIREFSKITFTEICDDYLVSSPLILTEINLRDRDGKVIDTRREIHSIVFVMGKAGEGDKVSMLQQIIWDGTYRAMYGCCQ